MRRVAQAAAGLVVGALLVEGAFWVRDGGAFPHINCYLPDDTLGLRLEPGATQRISFSGNPVTSVRIHSGGLRGAELPPPRAGEIVVVGDSQVFGLGVEEGETFSAQLAERTGRPVVNAGVPTYGPPEYAELARRLAAERRPATVVFTVNLVNDLFEWNAPNRLRHAEWDGWAVRAETAPTTTLDFPTRRFWMRQSHAVFAARAFFAGQEPDPEGAVGYPSEGTWTDLVDPERLRAAAQPPEDGAAETQVAELGAALEAVEAEVSAAAADALGTVGLSTEEHRVLLDAAAGSVGDIVRGAHAEAARSVAVTGALMREGVKLRAKVIARLEARDAQAYERIQSARRRGSSLQAARQAAANELLNRRRSLSVLTPELRALRDDLEAQGVELVVVALPIDVQVSPQEWEKYPHLEPVDMTASRVLIDDLVADARALGLRAVDTLPALAAAEPGAFLYGDIHMTPKGHRAVAEALAAALAEPAPVRLPEPGLPDGRTWMPRPEDWLRTPEAIVRGSTRARCETVRIREWLRVTCLGTPGRRPTDAEVRTGDHGEARVVRGASAVTLVTPLFPGEDLEAVLRWTTDGQVLSVAWEGEVPRMALGPRDAALARPPRVDALEERLCGCYHAVRGDFECQTALDLSDAQTAAPTYLPDCVGSCSQLVGGNLSACAATYPDDCADYLACAEGALDALPECPQGTVAVGGGGACLPLCGDDLPCTDGSECRSWQGTRVCG